MFDKTYITPALQDTRTEYVTKEVNIHEHRAPTNESVKFLKEMEAAAFDRLLSAFSVGVNNFKCEVVVFLENISDKLLVITLFNLNGKDCRVETKIERYRMRCEHWTMSDVWNTVRDDVAKAIAVGILDGEFHAIARGTIASGALG